MWTWKLANILEVEPVRAFTLKMCGGGLLLEATSLTKEAMPYIAEAEGVGS